MSQKNCAGIFIFFSLIALFTLGVFLVSALYFDFMGDLGFRSFISRFHVEVIIAVTMPLSALSMLTVKIFGRITRVMSIGGVCVATIPFLFDFGLWSIVLLFIGVISWIMSTCYAMYEMILDET